MNWNDGVIRGIPLDTGGMMNYFLEKQKEKGLKIKTIDHFCSCQWNSYRTGPILDFLTSDPRNPNGMFYSELYDDKFLHFRGAMNWQGFPRTIKETARKNLEKMIKTIIKS